METNTVYIVTKNYNDDSTMLKAFNNLDKAQKYCEDELQKYIDDLNLHVPAVTKYINEDSTFYTVDYNCENCKDETDYCKKYGCEYEDDYIYYSITSIAVE